MGVNKPVSRIDSRKDGVERKIVSPNRMMGEFFGKPSEDTIKRHELFRRTQIRNTISKIVDTGNADKKLSQELGMAPSVETKTEEGNPDSIFSKDEKDAYRDSIKKYKENVEGNGKHAETCRFFLRSLRMREVFKAYYARWVTEYKETHKDFDEEKDKDSDEFKEFIRTKGLAYIKEMAAIILESDVNDFVDVHAGAGESKDDLKKKKEEFNAKVSAFIEKNRDKLQSEEPQDRESAKKEFKQLLVENGYKDVSDKDINALFDNIVVTTAFEYLAIEEFEAVSPKMIQLINEDITDEEWEDLLTAALQDKHPEIKKAIEEQNEPSAFTGSTVTPVRIESGSALESLGSSSGFDLKPVAGMDGVYVVDAPEFKDKSRLPVIRMVDNRQFEIEMPYGDENAKYDGGAAEIAGRKVWKWKRYTYGDFQAALNRQLLDYKMNTDIDIRQSVSAGENPNTIMKDPVMEQVAVKLFGFGLNQRKLQTEHLQRFERLMIVLLKKGENGALTGRIEQINTFLADKNNAAVVLNILGRPASVTHNVDDLIRLAQRERMGKKTEGGLAVV